MKSRYLRFPIVVPPLALLLVGCASGVASSKPSLAMPTGTPESAVIYTLSSMGGGTGWVGFVSLRDENSKLPQSKKAQTSSWRIEEIRVSPDFIELKVPLYFLQS